MARIGAASSSTDLEALRKSRGGQVGLLGLVVVGALGAAAWSFLRTEPLGNPEQVAQVLVVDHGRQKGHASFLDRQGFGAAEGSFEDWVLRAEDEVGLGGVAGILRLADLYGYGYVAFEHPQRLDLAGVALAGDGETAVPAHAEFVVVAVGDLADPPRMTSHPPQQPGVNVRGLPLLQALFAQPELEHLGGELDELSLEQMRIRDRLQPAFDWLERGARTRGLLEGVEREIEGLLGDRTGGPAPEVVGGPLTVSAAWGRADGSILAALRSARLASGDGVLVEPEFASHERLRWFAPGAPLRGEGEACRGPGGEEGFPLEESPRYMVSRGAEVLALRTLSGGLELFRFAPTESARCALSPLGKVAAAESGLQGIGVPSPGGALARAGSVGGRGIVSVVRPGTGSPTWLGMVEGATLRDPVWADEATVVAVAAFGDGRPEQVVVLSTLDPLTVYALEATLFEGATTIAGLDVAPQGDALAVAADGPPRLHLLRLPAALGRWFSPEGRPAVLERVERSGLPTLARLDTNALLPVGVTTPEDGFAHQVRFSPGGDALAFVLGDETPRRAQIARVTLGPEGPSRPRLVTHDDVEDFSPGFAGPDGVVFLTRYGIPNTGWKMVVSRVIRPPEPTQSSAPNSAR